VLRKDRGEAEAGDVVVCRQVLIADADVDVSEIDDVAEVLCGAIVLLVGHMLLPSGRGYSANALCVVIVREGDLREGAPHTSSAARNYDCAAARRKG
jgi:hypothetical protein